MLTLLNSLWLGFLTSITPCVFTANIAIISYISKSKNCSKHIFNSSILYVIGRMVFYTILSLILSIFVDSITSVSTFLSNKLNIILGIILIFVGLVLLDFIDVGFLHFSFVGKIKEKADKSKYILCFIFGVLFAGMFCPITVSLFIANFLQAPNNIFSFILYGFTTGLPAIILSLLLILSKNKFSKLNKKLEKFKEYSSKITGVIFMLMGIFLILKLF